MLKSSSIPQFNILIQRIASYLDYLDFKKHYNSLFYSLVPLNYKV